MRKQWGTWRNLEVERERETMDKQNFVSCCNQNILCGEVWFLQDIKGFIARKMFIGQCPI